MAVPIYLKFCDLAIRPEFDGPNSTPTLHPWEPPDRTGAFNLRGESPWYIWSQGRLGPQAMLDGPGVIVHGECTIFYCPERGYIQVPYNSSERNVYQQDVRNGWSPISFEQPRTEVRSRYPNLWLLGHHLPEKAIPMNMNNSWYDLLGAQYFPDPWQYRNVPPSCELAGSLPLIFGLAAFVVPWKDLETILDNCFRPAENLSYHYVPSWTMNIPPRSGRSRHRGIVVKVAYDSQHRNQIECWERGAYGPILKHHPMNDRHELPPQHVATNNTLMNASSTGMLYNQ